MGKGVIMLDHLRLHLFFKERHLERLTDGSAVLKGKPDDYGFAVASRHVEKNELGIYEPKDLYAPYESLPSSYTGLAVKLFHISNYSDPYVEIKASPPKLLQGHNVFGGESVGNAACEMLGILFQAMPLLADAIHLPSTQIRHLDVTFSSQVSNPNVIPKVIDYMSRLRNGQTRPTKDKKFATTAYWGGSTSRLVQLKCYAKHAEMLHQFERFKKAAEAGDTQAKLIVDTVYTPELFEYSRNLMRWEARIKYRKLERLGIPTNLFEFIKYQNQNKNLLGELWRLSFAPIIKTFEGQAMPYANDDDLYDLLKDKLKTYTASGRVSYTKANNAMNFYHLLRDIGFEQVKQRYSRPTFYRNLKNLTDAGLSKAWLQNLHTHEKGQVIPLVKFAEIDFTKQAPSGYRPPVSQFNLPFAIAS